MAGPRLTNPAELLQAGIDPKTGLPAKFVASTDCMLKENIVRQLRVLDEQDAINRYVWFGLPKGLNGNLIERILYYKGQGALFYMETEEKFYFLPFALDGSIDVYGRFTGITPVILGNASSEDKPKAWIKGLHFEPLYDIVTEEDDALRLMTEGCVLLNDYSKQISQTVLPRQVLNEPIIQVMAECIPFMRTALQNSTGVEGIRVGSDSESTEVLAANNMIQDAALTAKKFVPIIGQLDFQALSSLPTAKAEEFLQAMQSLDNYRISLYGMDNGGLFQKQSTILQAEQRMNSNNSGIIMQDGLWLRQQFCDIANSLWGTCICVEVNETLTNMDTNMDGEVSTDTQNIIKETQEVAENGSMDE